MKRHLDMQHMGWGFWDLGLKTPALALKQGGMVQCEGVSILFLKDSFSYLANRIKRRTLNFFGFLLGSL